MTKLLNSNQLSQEELPLATDEECRMRRMALMRAGIIGQSNQNDLVHRGEDTFVSTEESSTRLRQDLIERGIIDPNPCKPYRAFRRQPLNIEEGEYNPKPIQSKEEYYRRLANYFCILQEILQSRINLNLVLAKKSSTDPDWIF